MFFTFLMFVFLLFVFLTFLKPHRPFNLRIDSSLSTLDVRDFYLRDGFKA